MPPKPEKRLVTPSSSVFDKFKDFFGYGPMPENVQKGIDIARRENPTIDTINKMGPIGRIFSPKMVNAVTTPEQSIELNMPNMAGQNPQDVADILAHEQTHVNQIRNSGRGYLSDFWHRYSQAGTPYSQRPDEIEAYQVEKARRLRTGRTGAIPSIGYPGEWYVPQDVNLPKSGMR